MHHSVTVLNASVVCVLLGVRGVAVLSTRACCTVRFTALHCTDGVIVLSYQCGTTPKATEDHAAHQEALRALATLEVLVNVTGVNGYVARSMVDRHSYITFPNDHWGWNPSTTYEQRLVLRNAAHRSNPSRLHLQSPLSLPIPV